MRELCSNQTNSILHGRLKQRAEHIARTQDIAGIMFLGKNARLKLIIKQKYFHMWRKRHTANSKHNIIERFWSTEEWKEGVLGTNSSIGQRNIEEGQINLLVILFGHLVKKTRHTGDFPRFHFETVNKLFSITVIPLFSQTSHSGQCHDSTQIESFNLLWSSKPFPLCLFLIPSPPELSCGRKSSCLSSDFRLPSLLRLFSQPPKYQLWLGNLEARNSSKNDKRKVSKDIDY